MNYFVWCWCSEGNVHDFMLPCRLHCSRLLHNHKLNSLLKISPDWSSNISLNSRFSIAGFELLPHLKCIRCESVFGCQRKLCAFTCSQVLHDAEAISYVACSRQNWIRVSYESALCRTVATVTEYSNETQVNFFYSECHASALHCRWHCCLTWTHFVGGTLAILYNLTFYYELFNWRSAGLSGQQYYLTMQAAVFQNCPLFTLTCVNLIFMTL